MSTITISLPESLASHTVTIRVKLAARLWGKEMQPYEYVLVLASIIVGLGIADLLVSLQRLLRARGRVDWDWAVPATALLVLMTNIQIWWALYDPAVKPVTIGGFLPILAGLILLFLVTAATLPDELGEGRFSLRDYYAENRAYFWTLYSLTLGWTVVSAVIRDALSGASLSRLVDNHLPDTIVLVVMASMALVRARWWHALVLGLLCVAGPLTWLSRSLS